VKTCTVPFGGQHDTGKVKKKRGVPKLLSSAKCGFPSRAVKHVYLTKQAGEQRFHGAEWGPGRNGPCLVAMQVRLAREAENFEEEKTCRTGAT